MAAMTSLTNVGEHEGLSAEALGQCLDLINGQVAILGPDDACLYGNRAWAEARGLNPAACAGAEPSTYLDGARLVEFEALLKRVRDTGKSIEFEDVSDGRGLRTLVRAVGDGRLLFIANPVAYSSEDGPQVEAESVNISHGSWGRLAPLTRREREIMVLLAKGLTIKEAAKQLDRSQKTIEGHRDSIYRKLGTSSRAELAIVSIRAGLMPAETDDESI